MKWFISSFILSLLTVNSWGNTLLTEEFKSLITQYKVGAVSEQSYCYKNNQGLVAGYQVDKMMPIASITKLFTTLFAVELLDLNKTYSTKFYIRGDVLHIEGENDPYFEEEKMLLLIRELNAKGYTKFRQVSFDENFKFSDIALGSYQVLTTDHVRDRILLYFNTKLNQTYLKKKLATIAQFAHEEEVDFSDRMDFEMSVGSVVLKSVNPFTDDRNEVFVHESLPLHRLIKSMNVMSKNLVSHYIFAEASKQKTFNKFIQEKGFKLAENIFHNGSGLPLLGNGTRKDNLTTCSNVLKLVELLHKSIRSKGFEPFELIAVAGGKDNGSFRDRFSLFPELADSLLAKTGTLAVASTLAGTLNTLIGEIPFSVLNRPRSSLQARKFQDKFVSRMFYNLGEATPFPYRKISIFPWESLDFFNN